MSEAVDAGTVCLSVITEAEVLYGLAKRPEATRAARDMRLVLPSFVILSWTSEAAYTYAVLRTESERTGSVVGALDMLITAHALSVGAVLVTSDGALAKLAGGPETVNWADDLRVN